MKEEKTYTIQEISQRYQLPHSTLRYYEELGLLPEVEKTPSHQRIYKEEHIRRLDGIVCFKRTGLPIAKIKEFYQLIGIVNAKVVKENIDNIILLVDCHEREIQNKIKELEVDLVHIQKKVRYYHAIKESYENGTAFPDWNLV